MRLSSYLVDFLISLTLEKKELESFKVLKESDFNNLEKALFFNKLEPRFINFLRLNNITEVNKGIDLKQINKAANIRGLHNLSILNNASNFLANLNNRKIDYRLLKGAYINTHNKKLSGFRPIKDIDILIRLKDIQTVLDIAFHHGYKFEDEGLNKDNLKFNFDYRYDLPNLINSSGQIIELHVRFSDVYDYDVCPFVKLAFEKKILKQLYGAKVPFPSPIAQILMAIYSGSKKRYFDSGSLFLSDVKVIQEEYKIQTSLILTEAKKNNLGKAARLIMQIVDQENLSKKDCFNPDIVSKTKRLITYNSVSDSKRLTDIFLEKKLSNLKKLYEHSISKKSMQASFPFKAKWKLLLYIPIKIYRQFKRVGKIFFLHLFSSKIKAELNDLQDIMSLIDENKDIRSSKSK